MYKKSRNAIRDLHEGQHELRADEFDLECGFTFGALMGPGRYALGFNYPSAAMSEEHRLHPGDLRAHRNRRRELKRAFH